MMWADLWDSTPNGKVHYANDTLSAYNLNAIKPHSIINVGVHMDGKPTTFDKAMPDFVSFAKCFTSSFAVGDLGNNLCVCIQVYDTAADFVRHGEHFTPWMQSGKQTSIMLRRFLANKF